MPPPLSVVSVRLVVGVVSGQCRVGRVEHERGTSHVEDMVRALRSAATPFEGSLVDVFKPEVRETFVGRDQFGQCQTQQSVVQVMQVPR